MKEHRWIWSVDVPAKVYMNEDKELFVRIPARPIEQNRSRIWCFDCEKDAQEVFGQGCDGYIVPEAIDDRMPDQLWEEIP